MTQGNSRAVVLVCRDREVARTRFSATDGSSGAAYTRTGRPFFEDRAIQEALLHRVRGALESNGLWDELETDWLALDCELLPWSAKALDLLKSQYGSVGASSVAGLRSVVVTKLPLCRRSRRRGALLWDSHEGSAAVP